MNLAAILGPAFPCLFSDAKPDAPEPMEAVIDAHFDALDAEVARVRAQMVADGLIRDPDSRTRTGDAP